MPFTISHAAAAIPFRRTRLVMSALIVGCMAPDFEYFLHGRMIGRLSHNFRGAFEFCLPATLVVLAVFHWLLKKPVVSLLPSAVQRRIVFGDFRFLPLGRLVLISFSALIGIFTHLFWDSFTHSGRWAVDHIAWFQRSTIVLGHSMVNYKVAQNVSTMLGLVLLAVWFVHWYRSTPEHDLPVYSLSSAAKFVLVTAMLAIASALGLARAFAILGNRPITIVFVANLVVATVSTGVLELIVFSLVMRRRVEEGN